MTKKIILAMIIVVISGTLAMAEWIATYKDVYQSKGIDEAVVEALKEGATPDAIMENGLKFEGLNPQNLVKAMYCGGIRGDDIRAAGQIYDVSDLLIVAGYKKSVEECGEQIADTQAYTPVASVLSFVGASLPGAGTSNISPSTFITQ